MKTILDIDELVFSPPDLGGVLYLPGLPGGSNKIYDRSPYGGTGTITGATWKRLPSGLWYLHYDGTDDRVDIDGTRSNLATTTAGTWQVWVYPLDLTDSGMACTFGDTDANSYIFLQVRNDSKLRAQAKIDPNVRWYAHSDAVVFAEGVWCNIALRQDGTKPVLYVNGEAVATNYGGDDIDYTVWFSDIAGIDNGYLGVMYYNNSAASWFKGGIALPHIHSVDKGADHIKDTFNRERHLFGVW